jgi:LytS/YehU family sensor histidine kinase
MIRITFSDNNDSIDVSILDNGVGKNLDGKEKEHKSRAMQIIKDRLYLFNKQNNSNASYQVEDITCDIGFKIMISLPKIY